MTKFYFGKTPENTGKTWENMQKHGKALDDKVLVRENTGKHWENIGKTWENIGKTPENIGKTSGKHGKTINNIGKYWITKFYFGKLWETTRKTWENMQKHGKALDDKVLFPENMGRHRKTCKKMGKYWMTKFHFGKTRENTGKTRENARKHAKTREING